MALQLSYELVSYPLRHPFTISRYTVSIQKAIIVKITDGNVTGFGEATANPYYESSVNKLAKSVDQVKAIVENSELLSPHDLWQLIEPHLRDDYFALCAIDSAFWDFFARRDGRTLRSYFSNTAKTPITSYTIGMDTVAVMRSKIIEFPWPNYKIKVGALNPIEIIRSLREVTDSTFRIDANCAWTISETISYSRILKNLNVEFIEQPLAAENEIGMKQVLLQCEFPIIADESCQREPDVLECAELFTGVNIKLMKCGGITPALRMVEMARKNNLKVMLGCMTESTVGISTLVQLAPLADYLDADGAMLLAQDIASGITFNDGQIRYSDQPGTGVEMYD